MRLRWAPALLVVGALAGCWIGNSPVAPGIRPLVPMASPSPTPSADADRIAREVGDHLVVASTSDVPLKGNVFYSLNALDPKKVQAIEESIRKSGYDRAEPIHLLLLASNQYLVLDGNHRFAAAEALGDSVVHSLPAVTLRADANAELAAAGLLFARSQKTIGDDLVARYMPPLDSAQRAEVDSMLTKGRPLFEYIFNLPSPPR